MNEARRRVHPGRLRRRLTIAFMLVAGLSAAVLAAGSYLIVREGRLDDSVSTAVAQGRFNLVLAGEVLREGSREDLLRAYDRRGGFITAGRQGRQQFSSSLSLGLAQVPRDLRRIVDEGQLGYERTTVAGTRYLVVGGQAAGLGAELYFFTSEEELWDDLRQLGTILAAGVGVLLLLGGFVGALLARRTLAPIGRASAAAHSLAEGLLETRLPVESEDEFGAWATSFNEMADALEAKIAALSEAQARERRFTSDVAHELRTPLTALVAEASLLDEHLERMPAEARRPAELLVADVGRLRRLVEDLMEISRLDVGAIAVRNERVDVRSLAGGALRARGWQGRVALSGDGVVLETDPRRLERIVTNLVGNALEHGGRDVSVRIGRDGVGIFVEVSDRGHGIPPDYLPHLFERFTKADPSRSSPGSGLGLAIALENARLLGGDVDVWSEVGTGSRFTLRLPVTEPLPAGEEHVSGPEQDELREHRKGA